ncbi:MAG: IniB N-terminal domain-containing protein, partial [Actinobacteria bacterium]|nr:IniB N-terminal domain-containing protein [Actinomycetota bacterium]
MTNVATTLLDFILNLLNDPEAMAAYQADREGALTAAGLGGCGDEVDTALTTAGAGTSLYYAHAPATFHSSAFHSSSGSSDDDVAVSKSFNDNIINSFNTTNTINDNDFTNNGVIIDGNGNTVNNTVSDDDTTVTNVNSNNTTAEGDVIGGDDESIVTNGGDGAGSGA